MKLKLCSYTYPENKAQIAVYAVREEEGIIDDDCLSLEFSKPEEETTMIYMRPDEALMIIALLSQGLNKSISEYEISVDKEIYEFDK
jgi:hypothetical protein